MRYIYSLMLLVVCLSGCAVTKALIADEATKCGPGLAGAAMQTEAVLEKATSADAAMGEIVAILQAAGADASAIWCVVQVAIDDLKTQPAKPSITASNVQGKLNVQSASLYPSDPVTHGIMMGEDVLAKRK